MKQQNVHTQQQQQELVQQQTLTALQVTAVRLTEMSVEALEHRVENECLENPWLEKVSSDTEHGDLSADEQTGASSSEDYEASEEQDRVQDYRSEDDVPDYLLGTMSQASTPENVEYGGTLSFYDQLKAQMGEYPLTEHQTDVLEYIIGSLDESGMLRKSSGQIADELEIYQEVSTSSEEVTELLRILWQFDPPGVGARSLQECLLIQIRRDHGNPLQKEMETLVETYFDDFIHKRWQRIRQRMKLTSGRMEALRQAMLKLNPRPGMAMGEELGHSARQITPDFFVEVDTEGNISLTLNQGNVPTLVISPEALDRIKYYDSVKNHTFTRSEQEEMQFTRSYVERGQMFIQALMMRRQSMIRTMQSIIRLQKDFFLEGDESLLRPMILEDVSRISGVSISVVSRVCNNKYVQTPYGTFSLKWFFSQKAATVSGDEISSRQVQAALRELIEKENPEAPYSDDRLCELLKQQGYALARRTVAKYREQMGIPVARLRK